MSGFKVNKKLPIMIISVAWCIFQVYTGLFGMLAPLQQRSLHVAFALALTYLLNPISKKLDKSKLYLDQIIILVLTVLSMHYLFVNDMKLSVNTGSYTGYETFLAIVIVIIVLEAVRRLTGNGLTLIAVVFLLYTYFGSYMPSLIRHPGASISKIAVFMSLNTQSIFGTPIEVCAAFIFLFILYAKLLEKTGGGQVFIKLASAVVGHVRGGPAKVAVLASTFFGSISGSAVANVVGTGTFTIPLMKKTGYEPHFAGAVEAVSSSGGQFMPPIMGATAFLIAEILSIPYYKVALFAFVPALLYYLAVFFMVDFEACKKGLKGLSKEELPRLGEVFKKGWPALVSPIVLIYLLAILQWSPAKSVVWSMIVTVVISMFNKNTRMSLKDFLDTAVEGSAGMLETSMASAGVGVVIGAITLSGLALKLTSVLLTISQGNLSILLFLTMIACIIMGMGLPTVACYIVLAATVAPSLIKVGVVPIAAHLFIFYFGIISAITPPVALASFAASGIAQANFTKTSVQAIKLGLSAFILPFMFTYNPALVLQGSVTEIVQCVFTAVMGIYAMSISLEGFFLTHTPVWQRITFGISAITLIIPEGYTDIFGVILFFAIVVVHIRYRKRLAVRQVPA